MQRLQVVVPVGVVPPGRFSYTLGLIRSGVVGIHRCSFFCVRLSFSSEMANAVYDILCKRESKVYRDYFK